MASKHQKYPLRKRFDHMRSVEEWHQHLAIQTGEELLDMVKTGNVGATSLRMPSSDTYLPLENEPEFRAAIAAIGQRRIAQAYLALQAMEPELKDKPALLANPSPWQAEILV